MDQDMFVNNSDLAAMLHDDDNDSSSANETIIPGSDDLAFNRRLLINVLAYSVMFVVGTVGNVIVFIAAYKQHGSPENQVSEFVTNRYMWKGDVFYPVQ